MAELGRGSASQFEPLVIKDGMTVSELLLQLMEKFDPNSVFVVDISIPVRVHKKGGVFSEAIPDATGHP